MSSPSRIEMELARHRANQLEYFGRTVTYAPAGGAPVQITAIPSSGFRPGSEFPAAFVELFTSQAVLDAASIVPAKGDVAVILGEERQAVEIRKDAAGGVTICFGP